MPGITSPLVNSQLCIGLSTPYLPAHFGTVKTRFELLGQSGETDRSRNDEQPTAEDHSFDRKRQARALMERLFVAIDTRRALLPLAVKREVENRAREQLLVSLMKRWSSFRSAHPAIPRSVPRDRYKRTRVKTTSQKLFDHSEETEATWRQSAAKKHHVNTAVLSA
jgi:hypothetical protein